MLSLIQILLITEQKLRKNSIIAVICSDQKELDTHAVIRFTLCHREQPHKTVIASDSCASGEFETYIQYFRTSNSYLSNIITASQTIITFTKNLHPTS